MANDNGLRTIQLQIRISLNKERRLQFRAKTGLRELRLWLQLSLHTPAVLGWCMASADSVPARDLYRALPNALSTLG